MKKILIGYYENGARKLHRMVDNILSKFGGIAGKDYDDFYSLANEVFVDAMRRYDKTQAFDSFLYACLSNKIKTEITRRSRYKRQADSMAISIDTPIGEEDNTTLADVIADDFDMEKMVLEQEEAGRNERVERYLASLCQVQRKIIEMKMQDIEVQEIKQELGLSDKKYSLYMKQALQYEHIRLLHT